MAATDAPSNFNLPNILSTLRVGMAIAVPPLLLTDSLGARIAGGIIFAIGALTDYFDGVVARRYGLVTTYGKIIDPIADKLLTLGAFITLSVLGLFPWWILVPIVIREVGITILRFYFLYKGVAVAAVKSGKLKTTLQMASISLLYLLLMYRDYIADNPSDGLANGIGWVLTIVTWVVLLAAFYQTLYSGYDFLRLNWHLLTNRSK